MTIVGFQQLPHGAGLKTPAYETPQSAGMDLMAALPEGEELTLKVGERLLVPTGFAMALPGDHEAQVRPRSGLAWKNGVTVLNSPGTIDADYRGEVKVILINHGPEDFIITRGMRIAQMVIAPMTQIRWDQRAQLDETTRGAGGFGSTGTAS
ncbi:dUTP diphosphatase [Paremcibacter congregatus]|uniref:Deoxyuridine 5'-triphosphate nucleotidohydrolase n=1 Tax=Paremcibacter congregatus TaxID=2043170 RepID=A0A2G4YPE0_9PROT|nr:dUTP diphosphatase [Paremcibacter congregatus]PHZ84175.1 dUTP diphosphatase [Paremcibacter congregatus]QDE29092.1 dUTP diphosphatase [Paremcibacter congregatus]